MKYNVPGRSRRSDRRSVRCVTRKDYDSMLLATLSCPVKILDQTSIETFESRLSLVVERHQQSRRWTVGEARDCRSIRHVPSASHASGDMMI